MKNQCNYVTSSREGFPRKWHMRSTCWKLKSHASLEDFASVLRLGLPMKYSRNVLPEGFLRVTFLPFTHTIYTLIIHKSIKEAIQREKP